MTAPVKFDRPPIFEVACGVLFADPNVIKTAHVGAFWQRKREAFPRVEDAAPIGAVIEDRNRTLPPDFEITALPPLRRAWLISEDGRNLIQIQQDRFLFNWKRSKDDDSYPSYSVVIEQFENHLADFLSFLEEQGIPRPAYRQFELTYVNHISESNGLQVTGLDGLLVDHIRSVSPNRFLPQPDGINWTTGYPLPNGVGRLHISAHTAIRVPEGETIVRLDLTARGIPADASEAGRRPWFDLAHEWITRGFADSTAPVLHSDAWQRTS